VEFSHLGRTVLVVLLASLLILLLLGDRRVVAALLEVLAAASSRHIRHKLVREGGQRADFVDVRVNGGDIRGHHELLLKGVSCRSLA